MDTEQPSTTPQAQGAGASGGAKDEPTTKTEGVSDQPTMPPEDATPASQQPATQPCQAAEPMDVDPPPTNGTSLVFSRLPGRPVPFTQQVAPIGPLPIPPKDCSYGDRLPHRDRIRQLPFGKFFECAGRPNLVWEVADYTAVGPGVARAEIPFLFKAFETGQIGPARMKAKYGDARAHTIHEYLDWTMIAQPPTPENDLVRPCPCHIIVYPLPLPSPTSRSRTLRAFALSSCFPAFGCSGPLRGCRRSRGCGNTPSWGRQWTHCRSWWLGGVQ